MPKLVPTRFTSYEFNRLEYYAATRLSDLTQMLIQSLLSQDAIEKSELTVDPKDPYAFMQREAELQGSIRAYEHLLFLAINTPVPDASEQKEVAEVTTPATQNQPR